MRLLLDCHISKATTKALQNRLPSVDAQHLADWHSGAFLSASDEDILAACHREGRIFVTFDQRTVPDLLRSWAAEQRSHSGVIFADGNTLKPNQPGTVASALARLVKEVGDSDTKNLVRFLLPSP